MRARHLAETYFIDVVVVALLVIALLEVWFNDEIRGSKVLLMVGAACWTLPLLARRRFPIGAPVAFLTSALVVALIEPRALSHSFASIVMVMLTAGLMGARGPDPASLPVAALMVGTVLVVVLRDPRATPGDFAVLVAVAGGCWVAGLLVHQRARRAEQMEERAARLERERETEARTAVAEERARIAREMHDVVAHSLSVMVVQAEAAEAMLDHDPDRARRPLAAVQETGRAALTELRRMLGVLREMADEGPALAPQPGLASLAELVEQVGAAGLPVSVRVEGEPRPLPPGIDLSAYRIVQEGLTNALKHAGPARAEVVVRYREREVELEVRDDGRGPGLGANGGHGLLGMRERVALYGGQIDAGPRPGGGFGLTARLPLEVIRSA